MRPPVAPRRPAVRTLHGDDLRDDYAWLRDKEDPEVTAYLEAENRYAEEFLAPTRALRERLYGEMVGRIQETDETVPYREGRHHYYSRTVEGLQYAIHCRRRIAPATAAEQVLLDLNELAHGKPFMALGSFEVSPSGNLLAYSLDDSGFRDYTLRIKELRSGRNLGLIRERVSSVEWGADDSTLFYTTENDAKRPYRLYRHTLGHDDRDALLYEEQDGLFRLHVTRTRSRRFVLLYISSHTTSEVRMLPATEPEAAWQVIAPRVPDRKYEVDHHGDRLYLRVNDTGRNYRLVTAPLSDLGPEHWREVIGHRPEVMLEGIDLFAHHCVVYEREGGLPHIRVMTLESGRDHRVELREAVYSLGVAYNPQWDTRQLRFTYQSLTTPNTVYDYEMDSRELVLRKRMPVLGGFDAEAYVAERVFATAPDATRIPISIVRRRDAMRPGPLLLTGYGAYGYPYPVTFSSGRLSLLDWGMTLAIAHIRGGGEMGKPWHDDGRMMNKMNTFTDFVAAAEHLIARGDTDSKRLVIEGGSAGGLLMGAVTRLRPDLFRIMVAQVPFLDVLNTMLDDSLPLTIGEYEEWGNPNEEATYRYMRGYCPYSNLAPGTYPTMLIKTSLNDSQVMYWEPAKYVARLRTLKVDANPLLFVTNMGAGHGGASGRYDRLKEIALDYAFILTQLGLER